MIVSRTDACVWGAYLPEISAVTIAELCADAGRQPDLIHRFVALGEAIPHDELATIGAAGARPMLTIEPWRTGYGVLQPDYALSRIADGHHDDDLRRWGAAIADLGVPVLLRFAHEMNGDWYPWAVGVNGNTPGDYRAAWRRMHAVIGEYGAEVAHVWAPNVVLGSVADFTDAYPGSDVVDILAVDGYNWGDGNGHRWSSPEEIFAGSLTSLREADAELPLLITEVGCTDDDDPERKAHWISRFADLLDDHRVDGFVWFEVDKELDWRFRSTRASADAFRAALRDGRPVSDEPATRSPSAAGSAGPD